MTLSDTIDLFDVVIGDVTLDEEDRFAFEIAIGTHATFEEEFAEPTLAATPFFVEFDEPARLDPKRAGLVWELPPAVTRAIRWRSPLVSLLFHLLPIAAIILFPLIALEPPAQIPVQLVFEPPPPPPPPPPQQEKPAPKPPQFEQPPRGPLSSVDQGQVKPLDLGRTPDPVPQPSAGQQQPTPTETETASTAAPVPPIPQAKPVPPKENQPTLHLPKPSGTPNTPRAETPREAPHAARFAGPAATRDEYLAYLVTLTRQHIDLLPMSVIGGRRGETVISVVVYDNGSIGPLSVLRGSGYPDIDSRIQAMVAAVHKFPPLPQWYQGNAVQLELTLKFPEALEQR